MNLRRVFKRGAMPHACAGMSAGSPEMFTSTKRKRANSVALSSSVACASRLYHPYRVTGIPPRLRGYVESQIDFGT